LYFQGLKTQLLEKFLINAEALVILKQFDNYRILSSLIEFVC